MERIDEIKTLLDITDNSEDAKLGLIIKQVISTIEWMTGYKIKQETITEILDWKTEKKLLLKYMPVKSITTIEYWDGEAFVAFDPDVYELDWRLGEVIFACGTPRGVKNIKVVYVAGDDTVNDDMHWAVNDFVIQRYSTGWRGIKSESVDGASVTYGNLDDIKSHPVLSQYIRIS